MWIGVVTCVLHVLLFLRAHIHFKDTFIFVNMGGASVNYEMCMDKSRGLIATAKERMSLLEPFPSI